MSKRMFHRRSSWVALLAAVTPVWQVQADEPPAPQQQVRVIAVQEDAAGQPGQTRVTVTTADDDQPAPAKYWLGILLKEIEGDLATYLGSDAGVLVESVFPDSPASAAGLKEGDVLLKAGDQALERPADLLKTMQNLATEGDQPSPLKLTLSRQGKEVVVDLVPAVRPAESVVVVEREGDQEVDQREDKAFTFSFSGDAPGEEIQEMLKKLGDGRVAQEIQLFRMGNPSMFFVPQESELSGDMEIVVKKDVDGESLEVTIKREGDEPAKITVERDGERQQYSADQLEELPPAAREIVEPILKGSHRKMLHLHNNLKLGAAMKEAEGAKLAEHYRKLAEEMAESSRFSAEQLADRAREAAERARAMADKARAAGEKLRSDQTKQSEVEELRKLVGQLQQEIKELRQQLDKE